MVTTSCSREEGLHSSQNSSVAVNGEHRSIEQKVALGKARHCVSLCISTIPDQATPCKHQQCMTSQKKGRRSLWIKFNTADTGRKLQDSCSSVKIELI